jgi:hypothetical protein
MNLLVSFLFTLLCKPGIIESGNYRCVLTGEPEYYYKYKSIDLETGVYNYCSKEGEQVRFMIVDSTYKILPNWCDCFEIVKQK